jgi:hypothetical protein
MDIQKREREHLSGGCVITRQLRSLGMSDSEIACMFSDLYWDAVTEHKLAEKAVAENN